MSRIGEIDTECNSMCQHPLEYEMIENSWTDLSYDVNLRLSFVLQAVTHVPVPVFTTFSACIWSIIGDCML